jgi:hypothetical protein
MPAANSGGSSPLSVASTASFRIADIRMMMDDDPRLRSSRDTHQALTVALVKPAAAPGHTHTEELIQGHAVNPICNRRADAVQDQGLHTPPFARFVNYG